jgi:high-affinity iron transporter
MARVVSGTTGKRKAALDSQTGGKRLALRVAFLSALSIGIVVVVALLIWQALSAGGNPDPLASRSDPNVAILDISVLVFREGLECILVLAAITAGTAASRPSIHRPVAAGVSVAFLFTLITWWIAIGVIDDLTKRVSALQIQAATGLLAILVLLVVMNWFFHKVYWTGWISLHTRKKQELLQGTEAADPSKRNLWWGFALLGFTSLYREGFEVVLFLQSYRLKLGERPIAYGVLLGLLFSAIVAVLTFIGHRQLPYRRMLVFTGVMLGAVLLVMVGEEAQEMQLAHWLPTTELPRLARKIPAWMGLWLSVFPTVETLVSQALAALLVLGSYLAARFKLLRTAGPSGR